jgi:hypothetical protein
MESFWYSMKRYRSNLHGEITPPLRGNLQKWPRPLSHRLFHAEVTLSYTKSGSRQFWCPRGHITSSSGSHGPSSELLNILSTNSYIFFSKSEIGMDWNVVIEEIAQLVSDTFFLFWFHRDEWAWRSKSYGTPLCPLPSFHRCLDVLKRVPVVTVFSEMCTVSPFSLFCEPVHWPTQRYPTDSRQCGQSCFYSQYICCGHNSNKRLARSTGNVPIMRSGVGIVHVSNIVLVSTTLTSILGLCTNKSLFLHVR